MRALLAVTMAAGLAGCTTLEKIDSAIAAQSGRLAAFCAEVSAMAPAVDAALDAEALSRPTADKVRKARAAFGAACSGRPPQSLTEAVVSASFALITYRTITQDMKEQ